MDTRTARRGWWVGDPAEPSRPVVAQGEREVVRFEPLETAEGTVVALEDDVFVARLRHRGRAEGEEEQTSFPLAAVADDDRALVVPGATFYWSAGHEQRPGGRKVLVGELRFRRLPTSRA